MTAITTSKMDGTKRIIKGDYVSHFFVTAVRTWEDIFEELDGKWNKRNSRCWGYIDTFEKAEKAVLENYTDMREDTDNWVIIEEHIMDVFAIGTGKFQWYHWNKNKKAYERCRQPDWAKRVVHWGIG